MIVVEDVHFRYDEADDTPFALQGISLTIPDGQFLAIIGPNGSGKSTLGHCLNGLLQPSDGRIAVDGLDTHDSELTWEIHQRVGMIFQNPDNQLVSTTVERELAFGLENLGMPSVEIQDRVDQALERFQLGDYRTHAPHRLSGGQKQRLAIAAVVSMQPRYLICDEPTALLDPQGRTDTLSLLVELQRNHSIAIIYITQFPEEVLDADRVIIMHRGKIAEEAPPEALISDIDILQKYDLDIPPTVRLANALRCRNVPLEPGIMHPEKLIDCLRQCSSNPVERMDEPSGYTPSPSIFPVIELQEVCYTYQSDTGVAPPALDGVTLSIDSGSFIALVGPNGSGKSTLMQHLNGLLMPDSGNVLIDGLDLTTKDTDLKSIRQQVGLIFQFPEAQLFEETVYDDVAFGPRNLGISEDEVKDRVGRALEQVRIDPDVFASRVPFTLSGGEKRRVAIAGILAMHPRFLVLDEPTAGLDAEGIHQIEDILLRFQETGGTTILVSHDMDLVARLAERVVVLDCGRIIADESPYTLFLKKDLLSSIRLQPPGLTYILSGLVDAGYSVNPAIFEIDVAADGIADCLGIE